MQGPNIMHLVQVKARFEKLKRYSLPYIKFQGELASTDPEVVENYKLEQVGIIDQGGIYALSHF